MELDEPLKVEMGNVESEMRRILDNGREDVYGMLFPFIKRGGKRIRPVLSLLTCRAFGGDFSIATRPAAVIELFHNFTLIHDDVADDSRFRRGEPTLHISHGIPIALNSGDALYTLVWKSLIELNIDFSKLRKLQSMYVNTFKLVVEGQGMELSWYHKERFDISESEYFDMIGRKTAALIALSCKAGCFLADTSEEDQKMLWDFGYKIGTAFQIHDDVLNITGDFGMYQKEIGGDISEGKRSLIIVHFLRNASEPEKEKMIKVLNSHNNTQEEIDSAIKMLKKKGSTDYASKVAQDLVSEAKSIIEKFPGSRETDYLRYLSDYVISRKK